MHFGEQSRAVGVGVRTTGVLAAVFALLLTIGAVEPVDLITPGGRGPSAELIREDFGDDAVPVGETGYDGQQFYAIARTFPDIEAAAPHLDAPRYRLLRIAAPAIASIGGSGAPVVLLLLAINLLGTGLACAALAALCTDRGWSASYGYVAAIPVAFGIVGSTADPISLGLGLAGLLAASRGQHVGAIGWFTAAALTREQMAAMAIGAAAGLLIAGERRPILLAYSLPVVAIAGWYVVLGEIVGGDIPDRFDFLAMLDTGVEGLLVATSGLLLSVWGAWAWRRVPVVWPVALGFGLWIFIYFAPIFELDGLPRASAPSLVFGLAALARAARPNARHKLSA